jgi:hypothetical protein
MFRAQKDSNVRTKAGNRELQVQGGHSETQRDEGSPPGQMEKARGSCVVNMGKKVLDRGK